MTICYFGMYASNYTRNKTLIKGFEQNGFQVIECNIRAHFFLGFRYYYLLKKFLLVGKKADVIFVGFPGQTDVPLAWILGKIFHKKVIFDAFFSLYVSQVFDRKYVGEQSFRAKLYFCIDWLSCFLADEIVLDTNTHIEYFVKTFHLPRKKFIRVFVGTDIEIMKPKRVKHHEGFVVGFHGSFLPLQGVPIILQAVKLLEKEAINFKLLGNGIEFAKCQQLARDLKLSNLEFLKEVPYKELADFISGTDIYLGGHFANSLKSNLVIANKVYEAMAVGKATIVGDSAATRELFKNNVHCLLIKQGNPRSLAKVILQLKNNILLREKIARGGYNLITSQLTPKIITYDLVKSFS